MTIDRELVDDDCTLTRTDVMAHRNGLAPTEGSARQCLECGEPVVGGPAKKVCGPACARKRERRRAKERAAKPPVPVATAVQVVRAPQRGSEAPQPGDWRTVATVVGTVIAARDDMQVALDVDGVRLTVTRRRG